MSSPVDINWTIGVSLNSLNVRSGLGNLTEELGDELFVGEVSKLVHGNRESGVIVGLDDFKVFEPDVESVVINILSRVGGLVLSSPGFIEFEV